MSKKNSKIFDNNKPNDINVSKFNSAFFLSPIEYIGKEPIKENNYLQNLENQTIKIEDEFESIPHKKDFQTPKSIDKNLKNCLGQDLLKHLDDSPMRQQKYAPNLDVNMNIDCLQNRNSFFYKKMNPNEKNEFFDFSEKENENSMHVNNRKNLRNINYKDESFKIRKFEKNHEVMKLPEENIKIIKKKTKDDFFIGMPLETEEAYFLNFRYFTKDIFGSRYLNNKDNFIFNNIYSSLTEDNENEAFTNLKPFDYSEIRKIENLKRIEKFEKILKKKKGNLYASPHKNINKSFYLFSFNNKIKNCHNENYDDFYIRKEKEISQEEIINLTNKDESKNEFSEQNKNYINFNYEENHNDSSTCKNINNTENEENMFSTIFSNNKIKKSNSTNLLGEFENKILYDPDLFSTDNTNLERIFHSPNFYNFINTNLHSKEKNNFEEENLNGNSNAVNFPNKNPLTNLFFKNKKNNINNNNSYKFSGDDINNQNNHRNSQEKFIGLMKAEYNSKNNNKENQFILINQNLEKSKINKNKKPNIIYTNKNIFEENTSANSKMQNNMPPFSATSEYSREIQTNNLLNKNKNCLLYPNYSDFSDSKKIPNLTNNQNLNNLIKRTNNNNKINNDIIYENQNDYETENYGINNLDEFEKQKDSSFNDIRAERIVNNFLNDEINFVHNRDDKCDESFDKRNFETFDCCNIDSFITPGQINNKNGSKIGIQNITKEDDLLKKKYANAKLYKNFNSINKEYNVNNPLVNKLNDIIEKKFSSENNDFTHPQNPFRNHNLNQNIVTNQNIYENNPNSSTKKPALVINDDMCFYPKSIRDDINNGNLSKNTFSSLNKNENNNNKYESIYNIIDNFKNFTNLSEGNISNSKRLTINNFLNMNSLEEENLNNSLVQDSFINNNLNLKPIKEDGINCNINTNINQKNTQRIFNDNYNENNFNIENLSNNLSSNNQINNNLNQIQGSNFQNGDKSNKQINQHSQNKTGWVCSQCKNFNYESKTLFNLILNYPINYFFIYIIFNISNINLLYYIHVHTIL